MASTGFELRTQVYEENALTHLNNVVARRIFVCYYGCHYNQPIASLQALINVMFCSRAVLLFFMFCNNIFLFFRDTTYFWNIMIICKPSQCTYSILFKQTRASNFLLKAMREILIKFLEF